MATGPTYRVPFRRRREGRTDYRRRLHLLMGRQSRVVVRRSNRNTIVQFVDFSPEGDKIRAQASALELTTMGWTGSRTATPAAYLTGLLAGTRAKKAGVGSGVLDLGRRLPSKGGRSFAALKGVLDAGVAVPHGKDVLPDPKRLTGAHLGEAIPNLVEGVKSKILGKVK